MPPPLVPALESGHMRELCLTRLSGWVLSQKKRLCFRRSIEIDHTAASSWIPPSMVLERLGMVIYFAIFGKSIGGHELLTDL